MYDDVKDEITIIDFGSSKIKTIIDKETTMPMYSENYSAPEVIKGNDITEKCDYYSLGAVFFEMLYCEEASSSQFMIETISKKSTNESIKNIICSMLQEQQEDRPESINVIMDIFSNAIGELNTTADEYLIYIDSDKLYQLKRRLIIEDK